MYGVVAPAPEVRRVQPGADVLVHLPADARRRQLLRVSRPVVAGFGVVQHGPAAPAVVADPARPHVVAVGIGRAQERAVVRVADREGVGQRVVERDVVARVVRHGRRALGGNPLVVLAGIPGLMRRLPVVGQVLEERQAQVRGAWVERRLSAAAVRLVPDAIARRQNHRPRIAEPAHAAQGSEVVIERAVLLHQEDDVLDVVDAAVPVVRRNGQRPVDGRRETGRDRAGTHLLKKPSTICRHVVLLDADPDTTGSRRARFRDLELRVTEPNRQARARRR